MDVNHEGYCKPSISFKFDSENLPPQLTEPEAAKIVAISLFDISRLRRGVLGWSRTYFLSRVIILRQNDAGNDPHFEVPAVYSW